MKCAGWCGHRRGPGGPAHGGQIGVVIASWHWATLSWKAELEPVVGLGTVSSSRVDARNKATGQALYVADVQRPGMLHAAVTRSPYRHARIIAVDTTAAASLRGVIGVYTAADVTRATYGRAVRDIPILARDEVRFLGEQVAAVVAESRRTAERAASLVAVDYEELPAVTDPEEALRLGAPLVHRAPWDYPGAACQPDWGPNLQSSVTVGDSNAVEAALAAATHVVETTYTTQAVHQGYIEPWACVAEMSSDGKVLLWVTNKSPYRLRAQLAACLGFDPGQIEVQPTTLGGDFGGKGSPGEAPLCIELARLSGHPVKLVLRYDEDLIAANPRHPARITVRVGADGDGHLVGLACDSLLDGGAYAGYKPLPNAAIHGVLDAPGYRLPAFCAFARIVYTHSVPKGHMRAPGAPQLTFAVETALDDLADQVGLSAAELRRRNLLRTGDRRAGGQEWLEYRGLDTLAAAMAAVDELPEPSPPGPNWATGQGLAIYCRQTASSTATSLCLKDLPGGRLRIEVPIVETGTGSHTVARELIGRELGFAPDQVEVAQVSTDQLPQDPGAGGSRVTAAIALAAEEAVKAWRSRVDDGPVRIVVDVADGPTVGSYCAQVAQVAVDPESGQVVVLRIVTAVDVADVVSPRAHQMQIDGGTTQGFGFACLEDLGQADGQIWAASLGDFKIPSAHDVPEYHTVLVPGGRGVGAANIKNIGESTTPPTAAAIANAVAAATGVRVRDLPLRAERIYELWTTSKQ